MAYSWSQQSVTFSRRRYHSGDISSVDVVWSATPWRLRTSNLGRFLIALRVFLGFVGYYRRFIPNFADIAAPMVALTGNDVPFVWDPVCSTAFYALRDSLIHAPILAFPTETGQYILDTDASNFGLGGVLSQIQDDVERVVAYWGPYCSRALRPSQRRYYTTKQEMLAAVVCGYVCPVPVVSTWRKVHPSDISQVIGVAASF